MNNFDVRLLNLVIETRKKNGTVYITIPKWFCKMAEITGSDMEQLEIVVLGRRDNGKIIQFTTLYTKDRI